MDDEGGASPSHHGGGGGGGGSIRLQCECGFKDDYILDETDDGRFYCVQCSVNLNTQATAVDDADFRTPGNMSNPPKPLPEPSTPPLPLPSRKKSTSWGLRYGGATWRACR
ncbi:hypothetical protein D1007_60409 [Hordeum vulgare]|nr:hypothetical protein D1007_60409 [Hordeum vulgare]